MQGNEPEFVIMPYEKYAPTASTTTPTPNQADDQLINQLNNEILALKEEIRQKESAEAELI